MAKEPMHKKMYKDSPEMKRDEEDGKMKAPKPNAAEKKSSEVNAGTDNAANMNDGEPDMEPSGDARIQEVKDMHKRHQTEMKAIYNRHAKEDEAKTSTGSGGGKEKISKVEKGE